jgi:hypothetical protein
MISMAVRSQFTLPVIDVVCTNDHDNGWQQKKYLILVEELFQ